jgi:hypothetical protein
MPVPLFGDVAHGPGRINESDIAHSELHGLLVLYHRRSPGNLKHGVVMLHAVEARIPVRPLDLVSVPTEIHHLEPANASSAHPP